MRGRRVLETDEGFDWSEIDYGKIIIVLIIIALLFIGISIGIKKVKNRSNVEETSINLEETTDTIKMPQQIEGYDVLGELVIEKISLDEYILDSTEDSAMDNNLVKLYGNELNKIGNFCIAGHNYDGLFKRLNELVVGDEFYIIDKEDIIQDYKVTEILEVDPTDLKALMPVNDKIQVTLITCKDGEVSRLVIKAERINIEV